MPTDDTETEYVKLGEATYEVSDQPVPYLKRSLGTFFADLTAAEVSAASLPDFLIEKPYEILKVFIPELMPLHRWEGFRDEADMAADRFDEDYARKVAPTVPQIRTALRVVFMKNELDVWKHLGRYLDPTQVQTMLRRLLEDEKGDLLSGLRSLIASSQRIPASDSSMSSTTTDPIVEAEGRESVASG